MAKRKYTHPLRLTDAEKEYIDNHTHLTINQVRNNINRPFSIVKRYIVEKKLPYGQAKVIEFKRPDAFYSNVNWGEM